MLYHLTCSCGVTMHGSVPAETFVRIHRDWLRYHTGPGHETRTHEDVQRERGEWDNYPAAMSVLDRAVEAEVRGRMQSEPIYRIGDDLDYRECNGK